MDEAIRRATELARARGFPRFMKANEFADAIWPGAEFRRAQGAGAAASRILVEMKKRKLATWSTDGADWGWQIFRP